MGTLGYDPYEDLMPSGPTAQEAEHALDVMRAVRSGDLLALGRATSRRPALVDDGYINEPEARRSAKTKELAHLNRRLLAENRRLRARLDGAMRQIGELRQALACQKA